MCFIHVCVYMKPIVLFEVFFSTETILVYIVELPFFHLPILLGG